jgi:hypothetical protein
MKQLFMNTWISIKNNYYFYGLAFITIYSFILIDRGRISGVLQFINLFCYVMSGLFFINAYTLFKAYKKNSVDNPISQFLTLLCLGVIMMVLPHLLGMGISTPFAN